jgi:hypothetical protein
VAAVVAKAFGYLMVGLRFPIILGWAAAVVAAVLLLPPLPTSGGLADLIPAGSRPRRRTPPRPGCSAIRWKQASPSCSASPGACRQRR